MGIIKVNAYRTGKGKAVNAYNRRTGMKRFSRGSKREKGSVRAFSRGFTQLMIHPKMVMASNSHLRGVKLTVRGSEMVNFASGSQKYIILSANSKYPGDHKIEISSRFLKVRQGGRRRR